MAITAGVTITTDHMVVGVGKLKFEALKYQRCLVTEAGKLNFCNLNIKMFKLRRRVSRVNYFEVSKMFRYGGG
jgi:hypothetical protein